VSAPATKKPSAKAPGFDKRERLKRAKPEAPATLARLAKMHPDAHCELDHQDAFQLLCATVLSAQTTDVAVNKLTPALFAKYPDARAMAGADPHAIEELISRIGMFRQKAKSLSGLAKKLVEKHDARVPRTMADLVELPGVGRKTANVVMGVMWGAPDGVVVDTHVQRISQRLGWTKNADPPKIEQDLCKLLPKAEWSQASHVLIFHGRRVCFAIKPDCDACKVNDTCPSAFRAENIGRKPKRVRTRVIVVKKTKKKTRD
jgi:endonuclease-3